MRPFDAVILNEDLPEHNLKAGTQGAIVESFPRSPDVFLVEFFDAEDNTIGVVSVHAHQITVTLADYYDGESIAVLTDLPRLRLTRGQVGVIKRRTAPGVYEVEFADAAGTAYALVKLHAGQMLLLHWQPAETAS